MCRKLCRAGDNPCRAARASAPPERACSDMAWYEHVVGTAASAEDAPGRAKSTVKSGCTLEFQDLKACKQVEGEANKYGWLAGGYAGHLFFAAAAPQQALPAG